MLFNDDGAQVGRFRVPLFDIKNDPDAVAVLLQGCVVLGTVFDLATQVLEYTALSADFDFVPVGWPVPLYGIEVEEDGERSVRLLSLVLAH